MVIYIYHPVLYLSRSVFITPSSPGIHDITFCYAALTPNGHVVVVNLDPPNQCTTAGTLGHPSRY